jgi:hypothetical protein
MRSGCRSASAAVDPGRRGPRDLRRGVAVEQAGERVEELRLADRLLQERREQLLALAGLATAQRAEQHERQRRAARANLAGERDAVHPGHVHVEDRRVERRAVGEPGQRLVGRRRRARPMPHLAACSSSTRRLVALSSTTSSRLPSSAGWTPTNSRCRAAGDSPIGATIVNENVDPRPGPSLAASTRPPMSSARRRLIARPSPVPPYLRVVDESACVNDRNRRSLPSA